MGIEAKDDAILTRVGGRTFRTSAKTTLKQDLYLWAAISEAGLQNVVDDFDKETKSLSAQGEKDMLHAYRSGALFKVMGGVLVEEGIRWTAAAAERNAEFFEDVDDPEDKKILQAQMVAIVLHFFVSAGALRQTSPKSLLEIENAMLPLGNFAGQKISESGIISSESLAEMTPINTRES